MVLLSDRDVKNFAAPIGRVVLYFAELESVLGDLHKATAEALLVKDATQDVGEFQWKFSAKIDQILSWLRKLGETDIREGLLARKQEILKTADNRHHVIHGQWWRHFMDKS